MTPGKSSNFKSRVEKTNYIGAIVRNATSLSSTISKVLTSRVEAISSIVETNGLFSSN